MEFKNRNLKSLAEMIIWDAPHFPYRTSHYITEFFEDCDLDFVHEGSTRWRWTVDRLRELLAEPSQSANALTDRFVNLLRVLMNKDDKDTKDWIDLAEDDKDRTLALESLNEPLTREGFEAFYGDDDHSYIRHMGTQTLSAISNPHRPLTANETHRRDTIDTWPSNRYYLGLNSQI